MPTETVSIDVPQDLYSRLQRLATLTQRPVESLVVQTLASILPILPDDLTPPIRDELTALESLDNAALQTITRSTLSQTEQDRYLEFREKRRAATLTSNEQASLDHLTQQADLLTLKKAYAAVLLKWRGQQPPTLAELTPHV